MHIYLNGHIVKQEEAKISPFDHGYMYGLGLFETFRIYNGHPFLFDDHLERLKDGLEQLNIHWEMSRNKIISILDNLLEANHLSDAYVRMNISAGIGEVGLQTYDYIDPTMIVYMKPIKEAVMIEKEAVILQTARNTPEGHYRLKSHHYLNNIIGKRELGDDFTKEGIFLTKEKFLAEGIVSNLFWVKNDAVFTPSLETGILNGITREIIKELLSINKIKLNEGCYKVADLLTSNEVFVTNSIQEIVPINKIGDISFSGSQGSITMQLKQQYSQLTTSLWSRKELEERIV